MKAGWVPVLGLAACSGSTVDDMQRALRDVNTGLAGALLGSEILAHMYDMPQSLRHNPDSKCGDACPCVLQTGLDLPVELTLDYATLGCISRSGLVPVPLAGHVAVDFDGQTCQSATFTDLTLALQASITGAFGGAVDGFAAGSFMVHPEGELQIGFTKVELHLDVALADAVRIDGPAAVDGRDLSLDSVVLPWDAIVPPCPIPSAGTVIAAGHGVDVQVRLDDPGDGFVTAVQGGKRSDPVALCDYASNVW